MRLIVLRHRAYGISVFHRPSWAILLLCALVFFTMLSGANAADPADEKPQTVVHLLDYVGVDYPATVRDGVVLNADEYKEQREFVIHAAALLQQLPVPEQKALIEKVERLLARIDAKANGAEVANLATDIRAAVIAAFHLTVAPKQVPDLKNGAKLFAANCVACHGANGKGDGPMSKNIEPAPSNFHDEPRMRLRSVYGLYSTITLGVGGTSMRAFTALTEADRWDLAFFVSALRTPPDVVDMGEKAWKGGQHHDQFLDLRSLVTPTPADTHVQGGSELDAVRAYLMAHPEAIQSVAPVPLEVTRAKLAETLKAFEQGDRDGARQLAVSAYLEGFELLEASLNNVDPTLKVTVEREMMALRSAIADGQPVDVVAKQIDAIKSLLDRAQQALSAGTLSPTAAFVSSLLILLREGLEAILVLSAIIAFVVKTERRDALPYIHAGWIGALLLGILTWAIARYFLSISGANREMTEGVTALIAAVMLLYVGYWLHSRSNAQAWQAFIRDHVGTALGKGTLWTMAGISFLAVYREIFEIILFYETLWAQVDETGQQAVLAGIFVAAVGLILIGGAILKYSVRLPIGPFFAATSGLLALMAVVFVGNGIAALQEAGAIDATAIRFVSVPLLGVHATAQGLIMQALTLALIIVGSQLGRRKLAR